MGGTINGEIPDEIRYKNFRLGKYRIYDISNSKSDDYYEIEKDNWLT